MGRKIYVRPGARKEPKHKGPQKGCKDPLDPEARERQRAAMKAYWANWRKKHGRAKEPTNRKYKTKVDHAEATRIIKKTFTPEPAQPAQGREAPWAAHDRAMEKEAGLISEQARQMFCSVGEKFGYALGKQFGDAMVEGIKRAQGLRAESSCPRRRAEGREEDPPPPSGPAAYPS